MTHFVFRCCMEKVKVTKTGEKMTMERIVQNSVKL